MPATVGKNKVEWVLCVPWVTVGIIMALSFGKGSGSAKGADAVTYCSPKFLETMGEAPETCMLDF